MWLLIVLYGVMVIFMLVWCLSLDFGFGLIVGALGFMLVVFGFCLCCLWLLGGCGVWLWVLLLVLLVLISWLFCV